jgi:hypothetical protein
MISTRSASLGLFLFNFIISSYFCFLLQTGKQATFGGWGRMNWAIEIILSSVKLRIEIKLSTLSMIEMKLRRRNFKREFVVLPAGLDHC